MINTDLVPIGFIRAAHGLHGGLLVHAYSGKAESLSAYGALQDATGEQHFHLAVSGSKDKDFICKAKNVTTRTQAEQLRGIKLFVPADKLPPTDEDEFYHRDLIGLNVEDTNGSSIGRVADVQTFGHGDALLIEFTHLEPAQSELLLFTKQNVPYVSIGEKRIVVELPDGLFADISN